MEIKSLGNTNFDDLFEAFVQAFAVKMIWEFKRSYTLIIIAQN